MRARVHEQAVPVDFNEPRAGADVGIGIEVDDSHGVRLDGREQVENLQSKENPAAIAAGLEKENRFVIALL
jgi:hypothetical protein